MSRGAKLMIWGLHRLLHDLKLAFVFPVLLPSIPGITLPEKILAAIPRAIEQLGKSPLILQELGDVLSISSPS